MKRYWIVKCGGENYEVHETEETAKAAEADLESSLIKLYGEVPKDHELEIDVVTQ